MNSQSLLPKNYDDARARFIKAALEQGEMRTFQVPSGKDDKLFVDELYVPGREKLLILTSGVHGLEASLGSAVQTEFIALQLARARARGIGVWIVHCLNPYGFKYGRRSTEDNVNLNRNFGSTHDVPNDGYLKLAPHFERAKPARTSALGKFSTLAFLTKQLTAGRFNAQTLSQAISQGQFTNPRGLEYGGGGPAPQTANFKARFEEIAKHYDEIVLADLHTGLGHRNRLHLLTGFNVAQCVNPETFGRLFKPTEEIALYEFNSGDEKGFYQTIGDINTAVAELAHGKRVCALTFEFGTLGNDMLSKADSLERMWTENQGFHHGYASEKDKARTEEKFRQLFEPNDETWAANALKITRTVLANIVERL